MKTEENSHSAFFQDLFMVKVEKSKSQGEIIKSEIDRYFSEILQIEEAQFDVLLWWKERATAYRRLSKLARRYLGAPGTSVPSERLFSSAGNLITKNRACLKPENVDKLLFLHKNW